jgi:glycerophosphoryl diester phosphodiesterase
VKPLVIAHRGACWNAPENTLEAFELAIEEGADYVEFDVRMDEEKRLVLCHDPVPDPCPPDLCTLDAALAALRGRVGLAVEIKEPRAVDSTMRALAEQAIPSDELIVLSFKIRGLEAARRKRPDVRTVLNMERRADPSAAGRFWGAALEDGVARPRVIRQAQSLGLRALVFTVNEPARMRELAGLGVDGIFSDRPGLLRETLAAAAPGRAPGGSREETSR